MQIFKNPHLGRIHLLESMRTERSCDLAVIGSGPGGQKATIQAAELGKRVAIVDRPKQ